MLLNCGIGERLFRVPWIARRSNQSILKEISPEYSLEELMLQLKHQYFFHLMRRTDSLEKTWCAAVLRVAKSWTRLSDWSELNWTVSSLEKCWLTFANWPIANWLWPIIIELSILLLSCEFSLYTVGKSLCQILLLFYWLFLTSFGGIICSIFFFLICTESKILGSPKTS